MLKIDELTKLAKMAAKADPSAPVAYSFNGENFSYDNMQEALRAQFKELAPDFRKPVRPYQKYVRLMRIRRFSAHEVL